ncbi:MAG: hypothetical protein M3P84_07470 [Chloroflexota bacterium]|nr:hypothetical protein [Chloroflexota bacterium]
MFPEALSALASFVQEATGQPTRVGRTGSAGAALTAPAAKGEPVDPPAAEEAAGVTLHLVAIARTERFQTPNREIARGGDGGATSVRQGPGWFDLTVALEVGGDQLAAADTFERLLSAGLRAGDLARTLDIESEYPVYALIDTPSEEELHSWWGAGLVTGSRAALKAVMTVAVQPFELAPVGIVRSRRLHTDDLRTRVRETVER